MILVCKNNDGKIIERMYRIPWEIYDDNTNKGIKTISIYKNHSKGVPWYEKYRLSDKEIEKANEILQRKLDEEKKNRRKRNE